jgi:hypothetical protein
MKKFILFLLLLFIVASCITELKVIYPQSTLYKIDFRKYSEAGFLITPEKYAGNYVSIGIMDYVKKPGAHYAIASRKLDDRFAKSDQMYISQKQWIFDAVSLDDAIDELYRECVKLGADALVNFKVELTEDNHFHFTNPVTIVGYRITGFAIKR